MRVGVALQALHHVGQVAVDVVMHGRLQAPLRPSQNDPRVDALIAPLLGTGGEETRRLRAPPHAAPAMAHQPLADEVLEWNHEVARHRIANGLADLPRQRLGDALVGIDFKNPVTCAGIDPGMTTRPFERPGALDDRPAVALGDRARAVGAAVEHHHDLVGEAQRLQAVRELTFLVARDHEGREAGARRWPRRARTRRDDLCTTLDEHGVVAKDRHAAPPVECIPAPQRTRA